MRIKILYVLTLWAGVYHAAAQGTAFTYQGRLHDAGNPANGTNYGMAFYLYDAPTNGNILGNEGIASVAVSNGLFAVPLDFGDAFDGNPRWLEITVQKDGGSFTTLSPRQQVQPVPYAVFAHTAGDLSGTISSSQLNGPISLAQLPDAVVTNNETSVNLSGAFTGNGSALTNLQLSSAVPPGTFRLEPVPPYFTQTTYPVGPFPSAVAVADFNGDGKMDLVCANISSLANTSSLMVLTNNRSGGFGLYATINAASGTTFNFVTTADIDGDGRMDLIALYENGNRVIVLTNNGNGGFGKYCGRDCRVDQSIPLRGNQPGSITAADVDGDGLLDLITANKNGTVTVLKNFGPVEGFDESGSTYYGTSYAVGSNAVSIVAADVNGDNLMDLITANYGDNTLTILTNNGKGITRLPGSTNFNFYATLNVGVNPNCVVAADVNGDNKVDLISANYGANTLTILTNNGSGIFGFNATLNVGAGPASLVAADLNGDGYLDLACANRNDSTLTVLTNNGSGIFHLDTTVPSGPGPISVAAADFNGDGNVDLVSANDVNNGTLTVFSGHVQAFSSDVSALFFANVGIGTTSPAFPLSLNSSYGNKLAIWDNGLNSAMGFGAEPGQFIFFLPGSTNRFSFLNSPNGSEIATINGNGNLTTAGNISAGGVFSGNGGGLTHLNYNSITNPLVIPSIPTAGNYVFAYDTNSQSGFIFFQGALFGNVVRTNGWTYSVVNDAGNFTCPQTGLYLIEYAGEATGNAGDTFSMAVIAAGIVPGSQASVYFPASSAGHPVSISKSCIASLNAGDVLKLESSGTAPSCHLAPDASVSGSITPSVSLTIVHIQ